MDNPSDVGLNFTTHPQTLLQHTVTNAIGAPPVNTRNGATFTNAIGAPIAKSHNGASGASAKAQDILKKSKWAKPPQIIDISYNRNYCNIIQTNSRTQHQNIKNVKTLKTAKRILPADLQITWRLKVQKVRTTKLESNEPLQWCETHQGNCLTVHPVKRPGTQHWIFVCPRCLNVLKEHNLVALVQRGQPFQHYHLLPAKLVAPQPHHIKPVEDKTQSYELLITPAQAVILRALGYELLGQ